MDARIEYPSSCSRGSRNRVTAAGWTVKDGKRVNSKDEPLTVEFLVFERVSEPHHALYIKNLGALGIDATTRLVDPVQYRGRIQDFDYDITMNRMVFSLTPSDASRCSSTRPGKEVLRGRSRD